MLIDTITIQNFRGIRDLTLGPQGGNLVIWGPNGSGKSGVIDALDFLFRGEISRLTGPGSREVSLTQHGRHVDAGISEAGVQATIRLSPEGAPVTISRTLSAPEELQCSDTEARPALGAVMELAQRGQHVLTRRDILRFIAVTPGDRGRQIEELLDLGDIGSTRQSLQTVANDLRSVAKEATARVANEQARAATAISLEEYDETSLIARVNEHRAVLDLEVITEIGPGLLLAGADASDNPSPARAATTVPGDVQQLQSVASSFSIDQVHDIHARLGDELAGLDTDAARAALAQAQLVDDGIRLQAGNAVCPLCDTEWATADALKQHLREKQRAATEARELRTVVETAANTLAQLLRPLAASAAAVAADLRELGNPDAPAAATLSAELESLIAAAAAPTGDFALPPLPAALTEASTLRVFVTRIVDSVPALPDDPTAERVRSRELLTRLDERLGSLTAEEAAERHAARASEAATVLLGEFIAARDAALDPLYESVRDRFVSLYQSLHEEEEDGFSARLSPTTTGMRFEVDFHNRGAFPPTAVHSEGHQDSMGLCLFLALSEQLANGRLEFLLLDDVVMSVDHEHRKAVCSLLRDQFPDTQLVITTHDRTWASQLRALKVVNGANFVEFPSWSIEAGPAVAMNRDLWATIGEHLVRGDVSAAAAALRRGCEEFFESACNALHAKIPYRSDYRWDFGDWVQAAMDEYRDLVSRARKSAQSWEDTARVSALDETDSIRKQVWARVWEEAWAINPNVHFNRWVSLEPGELEDVAQAYRDLMALFSCANCGSMLETMFADTDPAQIACHCGQQTWNLQLKA